MTRIRSTQILIDTRYQTVLLLLLVCSLLVAYFYLLSSSVVNVVVNREYIQAQREVASAITELEAEFIQMQHVVRRDVALQKGFVAVAEKTFILPFDTTLVAGRDER